MINLIIILDEMDAAGSHPVYPTREWENPLNDPSVKSAERMF